MLDPDSDFLFTPFALPENVYPLENCVISVSQFYDLEKNNLSDLIETLGKYVISNLLLRFLCHVFEIIR